MAVNMEPDRESRTPVRSGFGRHATTETKHALITTEFWAMVAAVAGTLIAAAVVGDGNGGGDAFGARAAWLYIAIVVSAYMIGRGLAKSGSYEPRDYNRGDRG